MNGNGSERGYVEVGLGWIIKLPLPKSTGSFVSSCDRRCHSRYVRHSSARLSLAGRERV